MMRFDVGPSRERQMLTQQLDRGRRTQGTKLRSVLKAMYGSGGVPNPMAPILRQQDSLKLTGAGRQPRHPEPAYTIRRCSLDAGGEGSR